MFHISQVICFFIISCLSKQEMDTFASDRPSSATVKALDARVGNKQIGLSTGHCFAEKPPKPNSVWVDKSCAEQKVGGSCIASCVDGYQMSSDSNGVFNCIATQSGQPMFSPQQTFECDQKDSTDGRETWVFLGLTLDKINFQHFHLKDVASWDLETQLVFGGAILLVFLCSCCALYKCCKTAWCCRGHFRLKKSSEAANPIDSRLPSNAYGLYPEMWMPDEESINGSGAIFVR